MPSDAAPRDEVLRQAMALDPVDREYVADELERSLPSSVLASDEIAAVWSHEIDWRIAAYDPGEAKGIDIDTALDHASKAIAEHRLRAQIPGWIASINSSREPRRGQISVAT